MVVVEWEGCVVVDIDTRERTYVWGFKDFGFELKNFLVTTRQFSATQIRIKSLQVLKFSHDLIRLFIKKLKKFHKKNIFSILLLAIILLPLKDQFWAMAKLRQFSHFLQQRVM